MKKAILSVKGQITIPQEIREHLHWQPGTTIRFEARRGFLIGKREMERDPLDEVAGILRGKINDVDAYLDKARGPRPNPNQKRK